MANQLLTVQELTFEPLDVLANNTKIVPNFYRDNDKEFGKKGHKIGDTLFVRKPARAIGRDGAAYNPEPMVDTEVPITINQQSGVDFEFSSAEKYLSLDDLSKRYMTPYAKSIANKLDLRCAQMAVANTANMVGTPGTTPGLSSSDAFQIYSQASQKLEELGFPLDDDSRILVINSKMKTGWNTFSKQFFNPKDSLTKQWKTGQVDNALGLDWIIDQNVVSQTIGALGGTPAVSGANQTGTTLNVSGLSNSITAWANPGDIFSIAGVFAVNPQSRLSTGALQQFVIQAQVNSDGGGLATFTFLPAIVPSGQFQNVSVSPANGALINIYDTAAAGQGALAGVVTPQALLWTKQAYTFMSFPGDVAEGVDMGMSAMDEDIGVAFRFIRVFDGFRDQWVCRYDVYYGIAPLYMEGGIRIAA